MINTREISYTRQIWGQHYVRKSKRTYYFEVYNGPVFRISHILIDQYLMGIDQYLMGFVIYEGYIL